MIFIANYLEYKVNIKMSDDSTFCARLSIYYKQLYVSKKNIVIKTW